MKANSASFMKAPHRSAVPVAAGGALGTCFVRGDWLKKCQLGSFLLLFRITKASHSVILRSQMARRDFFSPVGGKPDECLSCVGTWIQVGRAESRSDWGGAICRRRSCQLLQSTCISPHDYRPDRGLATPSSTNYRQPLKAAA